MIQRYKQIMSGRLQGRVVIVTGGSGIDPQVAGMIVKAAGIAFP
ncbi:MAG: hypothetical protein OXI40_12070 [Chloroflexota bacterium]|nr:hypothetical protein [Chloroflexota bacterium]